MSEEINKDENNEEKEPNLSGINQRKSRHWCGVLYPENMIPNWEEEIYNIIPFPFSYCIHDKDTNKDGSIRKTHVHVIIVFNNTTTYKHALSLFEELSDKGKKAINKVERVLNIKNMYDYLIHDTDGARRAKKYLYDVSERVNGNNFDIGAYEQLSKTDKLNIQKEISSIIINERFTNFTDFYEYMMLDYGDDSQYFEVIITYSGFFERLIKGNYHKHESLKYISPPIIKRPEEEKDEDEEDEKDEED